MELASIEKLLEKYLDAENTLQEEKQLQEYFISDNVAPHLQEYSMMFSYFKQSKDETFTQTIQLKPEKTKKSWKWLSRYCYPRRRYYPQSRRHRRKPWTMPKR